MAKNPMYSDYLEFAPTFRWGGQTWDQNERAAFMQFLRKRGGNYDRWARRHPNAARVFSPVEQQIYSTFQPQLTGIDAERKRTQDAFNRRMQNLTGFTQAVMGMLGGIAPAIGGAYREGAETMGAAGTGYGDILNNQTAEAASAANQVLQAIGAPEGQAIQGGDPGGVLAGLAGWIPETLMNQQGGAYAAAASQLPKTASIEAQVMMKDLLSQAAEADKSFSDQVLGVLQGLPGFRVQLSDQQAKSRLEQQKFRLAQLKEEHDWLKDQAALALAAGDNALAAKYFKLAQERERRYQMEAKGLAPDGSPMPGYYEDAQGRIVPKGYRYNNKGELVSTSSGGKGGKGTNWYAEGIKNLNEAQDNMDSFVQDTLRKEKPITEGGGYTYPSYGDAFKQMWQRFKHIIPAQINAANRKRLEKELKAAIRAALSRNGIKPGAGMQPPYPPKG